MSVNAETNRAVLASSKVSAWVFRTPNVARARSFSTKVRSGKTEGTPERPVNAGFQALLITLPMPHRTRLETLAIHAGNQPLPLHLDQGE